MLRTLPKLALCACLLLAAASLASARISPRLDAPLCSTTFYHPLLAASVQLDAWGNDSIRIRASPDDIHAIPDVQALLPYPPGLTPPADAQWPCKAADASLSNGNLAVSVSDAGVLTATRLSDNKVLLTTTALSFAPVTFKSIYPSNYSLYQLSVAYTHATGQIYGLGEHKTNRTQYVDFEHLFEDSQIYGDSAGGDLTIPWYISTAGFGLLYNQPGYGYVQITSDQALWQSNATHQLDLWLTTSPADSEGAATPYPALSGNYAEVTGHPNALPRFASGFWQSKDRYRNQSEILDITAHFHELEVPVEVFVIDWQHWQYLGDWSFWLPLCWPDPTAMVQQLSSYGMHTMISAWPRVDPRSANYADMSQRGYLTVDAQGKEILGPDGTIIYDAFNPAAREYVWQQLLSGYVQHGIQLFWLDAAEPEQSQPGRQWWSGKSDREVGMAWTVHHLRMIFEGSLSSGIPESQVITLVRHGWVGSALFNAFVWSGDVQSTWDSLGVQVRLAPNVALSGVHWWATDIGGYFGGQWQTSDFQELLVRWFQWGAFLPVFRTHGHREPSEDNGPCGGGGGPNELWTYWHKDEIAAVISLRQEIRPYVEYHLTQASLNGVPIVRPMWYNFTDAECLSQQSEDQYMFGPTWLVAPVLHPLSASKTRSVYLPALPKGELWVNYYTGATDQGGKRVDVALDLATFPLFQRLTREEYSARLQREAEGAVAAVLRQ